VTEVKRFVIFAAMLCLVVLPARLSAAPDDSTGPSRLGLALERPAVEVLPAAVEAATGELEEIVRFNTSGTTMLKNGFHRDLDRVREVRLTGADALRPTPFELGGGTVSRVERQGVERLVWTGEVRSPAPTRSASTSRRWSYRRAPAPGSYDAEGTAARVSPRLLERGGDLWSGILHGERDLARGRDPGRALGPGASARFVLDRVTGDRGARRRGTPR
jgi:hypothetical protein